MSGLIDIYIGRQPIFDAKLDLYAYELLFRSHTHNFNSCDEADKATAQVMLHAFADMGLHDIAGNRKVFMNFTESLLLRQQMPFFPPKQVVIEVLEDVRVTPGLLRALGVLRNHGFRIALDDYVFNPQLESLEDYADLIKVDILEVGPRALKEHAQRLKNKGVKILAEKVETREQFEFCRQVGFDYFQGFFFARPKIIKGKRLPNNKLSILELLANVYDPNIDMNKLIDIISKDVVLSQKLLKFLAQIQPDRTLNSVKDGVLLFGLNRLQSWASMLAIAGMDDKPTELFRLAYTRAKFCELVGAQAGDFSKDSYFTVGLFSVLDAIMDLELSEILSQLKLDPPIVNALIEKNANNLGITLNAVKALEMGADTFALPTNCQATQLSTYYLQSLQFAQNAFAN